MNEVPSELTPPTWELPAPLEALLQDVSACVWDFDGVIADTEPVQREAFLSVLKDVGVSPASDFFDGLIGQQENDIWETLIETYKIHANVETLTRRRSRVYLDLAASLSVAYYVRPIAARVRIVDANNIIVSSGSREHVSALLQQFRISELFDETFCRGWPPVPLLPSKQARLEFVAKEWPPPLVLIEDSGEILELGRSLGMRTIGVSHSLNDFQDVNVNYALAL